MADQLFPKPRRRMKQPRKDTLRDELVRAVQTIERLTAENERLRRPWWQRLFDRFRATPPEQPRPLTRANEETMT